ncbi:GCN5-related N-acetyltransferase [Syntrophobotulus glycolicus DSM 8271]|uniref:GCN5-related N-acetyltransferase n=1 Tax=Syntrophobotulus glycolicus (strain DSM 8271 / FlGlyR) TaxID=645991 RepID=F0SWH1_SYNGF|nr:GNAT family N-acetyltransferase [Syntrophobotulus glycolicus]ADY55737.1 GCN5-related N-acetyltransferase [Syntrophobotulus glycolicus DSM 8271]
MNKRKNGFAVRWAEAEDAGVIWELIHRLAALEKMEDQVTATVEDIRISLFEKKQAEVIIGEAAGEPAAFALFFHHYSTFLGHANLYLEDLFVREEYRGRGLGRALLSRLAEIALERGCGRLDWLCLDWNAPAISFYQRLGARVLDDRRVWRISGDRLTALAGSKSV